MRKTFSFPIKLRSEEEEVEKNNFRSGKFTTERTDEGKQAAERARVIWIIFLRTRWLLSENFNNLQRDHKSFYFCFQFCSLLKIRTGGSSAPGFWFASEEFFSHWSNILRGLSAFGAPPPSLLGLWYPNEKNICFIISPSRSRLERVICINRLDFIKCYGARHRLASIHSLTRSREMCGFV